MSELHLVLLLVALVLDWFFGEPEALWSRLPHPVVLFGKAVSFSDKLLNRDMDGDDLRYRKGALAISALVILAVLVGVFLEKIFSLLGWFGFAVEVLVVFILLAQRSLYEHVEAVADGLAENGIEGGRKAVAMIVGRDPETLDASGVSRAAIESLAENFSDGVVAPAFWYVVFGLPGIIAYKMINTADSMIGYKNDRYLWFGRAAAKLDDLANWLPARISAFLISCGAFVHTGASKAIQALKTAFRDSNLHRSPNAGWPESAMAAALGIALGGPRHYPGEVVPQAYLNSVGRKLLTQTDIRSGLSIFKWSCFALWIACGLLLLIL